MTNVIKSQFASFTKTLRGTLLVYRNLIFDVLVKRNVIKRRTFFTAQGQLYYNEKNVCKTYL